MIIKATTRTGREYYVRVVMTPMEKKAYSAWGAMINRCKNPGCTGYESYGGRGIKVCDRWAESFEAFVQDVGLPPDKTYSIDRTNPNSDYEPGNLDDGRPKVKWALLDEQHRNRRNTVWVEIEGVTKSASEWARIGKMSLITFLKRMEYGKTGKDLLKPVWSHVKLYDCGEGRMLTMRQIQRITRCSEVGIRDRINRGIKGAALLERSQKRVASQDAPPELEGNDPGGRTAMDDRRNNESESRSDAP